jgi:hypothetical protein
VDAEGFVSDGESPGRAEVVIDAVEVGYRKSVTAEGASLVPGYSLVWTPSLTTLVWEVLGNYTQPPTHTVDNSGPWRWSLAVLGRSPIIGAGVLLVMVRGDRFLVTSSPLQAEMEASNTNNVEMEM